MYTMGDIARMSVQNEKILYRMFGVNAELLIDHAWGWEPCTIAEIKSYKPENNSICSGQVLQCPYTFEKTRIVVREMAEMMALDLVDKGMVTDQMVLTVGYDIENLSDPVIRKAYTGEITIDRHGRSVPKHAHGTQNLSEFTNSTYEIIENTLKLYDRIINRDLLIRRITLTANHIKKEQDIVQKESYEQLAGIDVLIMNALRIASHPTHQNLEEALAVARRIQAKKTYFIHMSHDMGLHAEVEKNLLENIHLAFDGLDIYV